jgi:uncharacterized membrane protein
MADAATGNFVNGDAGRLPVAPTELAVAADHLEQSIARLLTAGTYGSVALLVVGTAMMLAGGVQPLSGGPRFDVREIGDDLVHLRAAGFLWLGLMAVVATPAIRVVASLFGYLSRGERLMALVAALILAVIALSVGLAIGLGA